MFRLRLIAGLALALVMCAPLAIAAETVPDIATYDTAQPDVQVAATTNVQDTSQAAAMARCTGEAAPARDRGASYDYTAHSTATSGHTQRPAVAAGHRPGIG